MEKSPLFPFFGHDTLSDLKGRRKKRFLQKIRILRNLYVHGPASNADIAERLSISLPTSLNIVEELLENGLVEKTGIGTSSGGRKPVLIGLKENSLYSLGIHSGRHTTRMAVYNNSNHNISGSVELKIDLTNRDEYVNEVFKRSEELVNQAAIDTRKLLCVGIVMPGMINSDEGKNFTHLNFGTIATSEIFENKFNRPVFIDNDAKAIAHAELRFGKARGLKNVLVVFLEWGLGLGIVINGKIYRGSSGFAGELSHIPAVDNKIYCQCGKQGCLETIASGAAIARMAKEGIETGNLPELRGLKADEADRIETEAIVNAANNGDHYAIKILSEIGLNLGKGLSGLLQLFNPERVILSGKVCEARQYIVTPIQQSLNTYCIPKMMEKTEVVVSELGSDRGILGAVSMAMEHVFDKPFMVRASIKSPGTEKKKKTEPTYNP